MKGLRPMTNATETKTEKKNLLYLNDRQKGYLIHDVRRWLDRLANYQRGAVEIGFELAAEVSETNDEPWEDANERDHAKSSPRRIKASQLASVLEDIAIIAKEAAAVLRDEYALDVTDL